MHSSTCLHTRLNEKNHSRRLPSPASSNGWTTAPIREARRTSKCAGGSSRTSIGEIDPLPTRWPMRHSIESAGPWKSPARSPRHRRLATVTSLPDSCCSKISAGSECTSRSTRPAASSSFEWHRTSGAEAAAASAQERRFECLDCCLRKLKPDQRELIVDVLRCGRGAANRPPARSGLPAGHQHERPGDPRLPYPKRTRNVRRRLRQGRSERIRACDSYRNGPSFRVNMPISRASMQDDRQLIRYLLGLLTDEEAERYDEQSIVDDDLAARLRVVEDNLVDAYVNGTLEEDLRQRFESFYLSSPRRREKVRFAARFLGAVDRASSWPPRRCSERPRRARGSSGRWRRRRCCCWPVESCSSRTFDCSAG